MIDDLPVEGLTGEVLFRSSHDGMKLGQHVLDVFLTHLVIVSPSEDVIQLLVVIGYIHLV